MAFSREAFYAGIWDYFPVGTTLTQPRCLWSLFPSLSPVPPNSWACHSKLSLNLTRWWGLKSSHQLKGKGWGKRERDCGPDSKKSSCTAAYFAWYQGICVWDLSNAPTSGNSSSGAQKEHRHKPTGNHSEWVSELPDLFIYLNLPTTKENLQANTPYT